MKKGIKAERDAARKAGKNTFAGWGFPSFPSLFCDGGFLLPGQAGTVPKCNKGRVGLPSIHSLFRDPDPIRTLLVHSTKRLAFFFPPQDYSKILLCGLTNFHINVASDLQSLLLKLRDPNKLVHFALRYPSFKQSVFYKPIMDQVKNFMHLTKLKRFYCSFPLRFYLSTVSTFRVSCIKSFPLEGTISFWSAIWLSFIIQSENVHTRNSILKQIRSLIFLLFGVLIINIIGSVIEIHFQFHRVPD